MLALEEKVGDPLRALRTMGRGVPAAAGLREVGDCVQEAAPGAGGSGAEQGAPGGQWGGVHTAVHRLQLLCNGGDLGSIPELEISPVGGHGNPLQCSCLENPGNGGAWWAAVYGVSESRTLPKRLSSSSRWPKYWSLNFSISPFNEYSGLTSFRID